VALVSSSYYFCMRIRIKTRSKFAGASIKQGNPARTIIGGVKNLTNSSIQHQSIKLKTTGGRLEGIMQEHVNDCKSSETLSWFFCDGAHPEQRAVSALPELASGTEPRSHVGRIRNESPCDLLLVRILDWPSPKLVGIISMDIMDGYYYHIIVAHQPSSEIP
jgi:hypothetical protein